MGSEEIHELVKYFLCITELLSAGVGGQRRHKKGRRCICVMRVDRNGERKNTTMG